MEIRDLTKEYQSTFLHCLEDWSDTMKESGSHKEIWCQKMKDKGHRVKIAIEDNQACGMIQYIPSELAFIEGHDLYFIQCIWVHGYKQGVGNHQKRGIGKALLQAAEEDIRSLGKKGVAAWGVAMPFWMKASWFRKQGYLKADRNSMSVLLWKPFTADADPPKWIRQKRKPEPGKDRVKVTSFINGWCPAQSLVHERAKRAAAEFGDLVLFEEISTLDRNVFLEWGIADGLYIEGKPVGWGPPLQYEKIRKKIGRAVKRKRGTNKKTP